MVDKPFTILMTRDRLHNVVISIITVNFYKRCLLTQTTSLHWYLEYIYLTRQFNIDYNILNYVNQFSRRSSRKKGAAKSKFYLECIFAPRIDRWLSLFLILLTRNIYRKHTWTTRCNLVVNNGWAKLHKFQIYVNNFSSIMCNKIFII